MKNYLELLKAKFDEKDIEWKVQISGIKDGKPWVMVVPYINARAIQERLDSIFGFENWEDSYQKIDKSWICTLKVTINDRQISKQNGADETKYEATKGGISDSFKRVASSGYGIGRYLYNMNSKFVECSLEKKNGFTETQKHHDKKSNKTTYIYWKKPNLNKSEKPEKPEKIKENKISALLNKTQINYITGLQKKISISDEKLNAYLLKNFDKKSLISINNDEYTQLVTDLLKMIRSKAV